MVLISLARIELVSSSSKLKINMVDCFAAGAHGILSFWSCVSEHVGPQMSSFQNYLLHRHNHAISLWCGLKGCFLSLQCSQIDVLHVSPLWVSKCFFKTAAWPYNFLFWIIFCNFSLAWKMYLATNVWSFDWHIAHCARMFVILKLQQLLIKTNDSLFWCHF